MYLKILFLCTSKIKLKKKRQKKKTNKHTTKAKYFDQQKIKVLLIQTSIFPSILCIGDYF